MDGSTLALNVFSGERIVKRRVPRAERRVQLLKVAYEIIVNEGIGALNMSVLAQRSGAVKPVVYEHFENSQEILFCLIDDYFANLSRYVLGKNTGSKDIWQFFDTSIDAMFDFHRRENFNLKRITNGFSAHQKTNNLFFDYTSRSILFHKIILEQQGVESATAEVAAEMLQDMILCNVNEYACKDNAEHAKALLKQAARAFLATLVQPDGPAPVPPIEVLKLS